MQDDIRGLQWLFPTTVKICGQERGNQSIELQKTPDRQKTKSRAHI